MRKVEPTAIGLELTSAPRPETQLNHALYDFVCTPARAGVFALTCNTIFTCAVVHATNRCISGFGATCWQRIATAGAGRDMAFTRSDIFGSSRWTSQASS